MLTVERLAECESVRAAVVRWAESRTDVRGVAIVGSWGREQARMDSDLDVVVLTHAKAAYVTRDAWVGDVLGARAPIVRRRDWGPLLTERRVRLASGFELEFGFAPLSWASIDPLDPGTAGVVRDGCLAVYDPDRLIAGLVDAVG